MNDHCLTLRDDHADFHWLTSPRRADDHRQFIQDPHPNRIAVGVQCVTRIDAVPSSGAEEYRLFCQCNLIQMRCQTWLPGGRLTSPMPTTRHWYWAQRDAAIGKTHATASGRDSSQSGCWAEIVPVSETDPVQEPAVRAASATAQVNLLAKARRTNAGNACSV